jgi:hypothetical protein
MTGIRTSEPSSPSGEPGVVSRREVLVGTAAVGLGVGMRAFAQTGGEQERAPRALPGRAPRAAHPPVEEIAAVYGIRGNFHDNTLTLQQSSVRISGSYDDGTVVDGTVVGQRPGPVTVTFTRTLQDGAVQTYFGAVSTQRSGASKAIQMSGVFYHDGSGPYPWNATGTAGG